MRYWLIAGILAGILLLPSGLFASQQFRGPHVGILSSTRSVAQAPGGGGGGGATIVQQRKIASPAANSGAYSGAVTAGNTLVLFAPGFQGCTAASISSSNGNTWVVTDSSNATGNTNMWATMGVAQNANAGIDTVTMNYGGTCYVQTLYLLELSGPSAAALEYANASSGSGTSSNTGNLLASANTKVMVSGVVIDASGTNVAAQVNPWTQLGRETDGTGSYVSSFAILGTTSTFVDGQVYRSTHTHTSANWASTGVALK